MSRRKVLKAFGAGAAASILAPGILVKADEKDKKTVLGSGAHTYEWMGNWCKLPDTHKFGNTHGVQVDSQGRLLVHSQNAAPDSVFIFDTEGKFIKSWGAAYRGGAHGLQLVKEGNQEFLILALTGQHAVVKTTLDGEAVWKLEFPKECEAYQGKPDGFVPTNVAVAKNGDVYVADGYGKSLIHQYGKDLKHIRSWGGAGSEAGKMRCCHGIWIDTRSGQEEICVADRANVRLQYFSMDGKHLRFVTGELRHHDVLDAQARGCTIILAGHTNTEHGYLKVLRRRLAEELPRVTVQISKRDADPLKMM